MYSLPYFKEADQQVVFEFIRQHPFSFLSGVDAGLNPVATQVPVFIEKRNDKLFLSGHLMKNTDHHKAFLHNNNVLAVFTGPHTYVSASWYTNPQTASTWNYISVHVKGKLKFTDEVDLINILKKTTNHFENNPHSPSNFENLPGDYINKLIQAIVAFEIEVTAIDNTFKLSQNHDEKTYLNIIQQLEKQGGDAKKIAGEMKNRASQLFNK